MFSKLIDQCNTASLDLDMKFNAGLIIMVKTEKAIFAFILCAILGVASSLIVSDDTFWQLQSGRYMLETKSLIRTDTFTLTFDAPRIEHCWLHDIIYFFIYSQSGYDGISLLKGLLVTLTATFLILTARSGPASVPSLLILTIPAFLLSHWAWLDRPQLWSFLAFAVFIYFLERYRKKPDRTIFYFLPVMVLWSNLHAGAMLALPVMAAYLAGEGAGMIFGRSRLSRIDYTRLWLFSFFLILASVITPYGDVHILSGLFRNIAKGGWDSLEINSRWCCVIWTGRVTVLQIIPFSLTLLASPPLFSGWAGGGFHSATSCFC